MKKTIAFNKDFAGFFDADAIGDIIHPWNFTHAKNLLGDDGGKVQEKT
jgi:hypothetical protein